MTTKRYLILALVLSMMVNLVLVGVFIGRVTVVGSATEAGVKGFDPTHGLRYLVGDLEEERQKTLEPLLRSYFSTLRPRFRQIRGSQESLREAMLSEPLDRTALKSALAEFNSHLFQTQEQAQDALVELADAMTLEERGRLVTYLEHPPRRERLRRPLPRRDHLPGREPPPQEAPER
jgi:uncharacterized membrane protein